MSADEQLDRELMALALAQARDSLEAGGVPVGAVLADGATVLGQGHNERVQHGDPVAPGENSALPANPPRGGCFSCNRNKRGTSQEMGIMRRTTLDKILGWVGTSLGIVLLAVGGLVLWGSAYVHNTVQGQLAAQQITFPPAAAFAHPQAGAEITPSLVPRVSPYAAQPLLTGQQAQAYADHFIALHL